MNVINRGLMRLLIILITSHCMVHPCIRDYYNTYAYAASLSIVYYNITIIITLYEIIGGK